MLHFNKKKLLSSCLYFHISKKSKEKNFGVLKILIGIFFIFINLKSEAIFSELQCADLRWREWPCPSRRYVQLRCR